MDKQPHNAQNVVTMSDYQPETGFSAVAQVEAYWEAVRGSRLLPKRSDIDPRGIEQALEFAFILERIAPGIARLRIAGGHLTDLMGMEARGMPLTAFFMPEARPIVSDLLEVVFQTPAVGSLRLTSAGGAQRQPLEARMVLLPLKSDLGDVSRVLGCCVSKGDIGLAPRRFDITSHNATHIRSGLGTASDPVPAPVQAPGLPPQDRPRTRGMSEEAGRFTGKGDRPTRQRPPYLRLVQPDE